MSGISSGPGGLERFREYSAWRVFLVFNNLVGSLVICDQLLFGRSDSIVDAKVVTGAPEVRTSEKQLRI